MRQRSTRRPLKVLAGAILFASLSACVTPGVSPRFYALSAESPANSSSVMAARRPASKQRMVVIQDIRIPAYLDRPQIVTRDTANQLEWSEIDQWGGVFKEDLLRILAMNLGNQLPSDRVAIAPFPLPSPPDYRIDVEILSFERLPNHQVELIVQWWISRGADRSLLTSSNRRFVGEATLDASTYNPLVHAMSLLYGKLAEAIAVDLQGLATQG